MTSLEPLPAVMPVVGRFTASRWRALWDPAERLLSISHPSEFDEIYELGVARAGAEEKLRNLHGLIRERA
jgi:hypothetical protein